MHMAITPLTKKRVLYSDFGKNMIRNPISNDLSRKTNEESIKESIRNLILTDRGERLFQPNIGCDIRSQLFENVTEETIDTIRNMIMETIESYEPRCELVGVEIEGDFDSNSLTVNISFVTINSEEPTELQVVLNRIR